MAGLFVVGMWWPEIQVAKAADLAAHGTTVYNGGVASILCSFPNPGQTNLGYLFLQEFFVDSFIGIVIWACLDPANPFVSPVSVPFTIGLVYGAMVSHERSACCIIMLTNLSGLGLCCKHDLHKSCKRSRH